MTRPLRGLGSRGLSLTPGKDCTVGGEGEAVVFPCRQSDDPPASEGLDRLRQQLVLLVAVAQLATTPVAPAPDGAIGGGGEAVE